MTLDETPSQATILATSPANPLSPKRRPRPASRQACRTTDWRVQPARLSHLRVVYQLRMRVNALPTILPSVPGSRLNVGVRPVVALGQFSVPMSGRVLEFDLRRITRYPLLRRHTPRRGQRGHLVGKRFREHIIKPIGPAAVVLHDPVVELRHVSSLSSTHLKHGVRRPVAPYATSPAFCGIIAQSAPEA
jgi:hypothetical protein